MSQEKVVALSFPPRVTAEVADLQFDLFQPTQSPAGFFVFLDLDAYEQGDLLRVFARNAVSALIDLRPVPVFRRPRYNHREIVQFLSESRIAYFDYAMVQNRGGAYGDVAIGRAVNRGRARGLTVCLYDERARERGLVDLARSNFNRSRFFKAELSPRALNT